MLVGVRLRARISGHQLCRTPRLPRSDLTIEDLIADEDRVAARLTAVGTHLGEFRGIPATGRRITTETFDIVRVADEKIAERWTIFDRGGLLLEPQQRR